jgi:aspartate racemase
MKIIGLIGGMSWESAIPYYRFINETLPDRLGGLHSAKIILYSVDFHDIERLQRTDDREKAVAALADAARALETAGADFRVLCTKTMHRVADTIEDAVRIPLLHIADATAERIRQDGFNPVGLLGTRFTMKQEFYRDRLERFHGLTVLIPEREDRELVHRIIYDELCLGKFTGEAREEYQRIIGELVTRGAQAVILGCMEIALLVAPQDAAVPLFDTTRIHAQSAAERALET